MAVRLHGRFLPGLFALAISTLLYISWTDIRDILYTLPDPTVLTPIRIMDRQDYRRIPQWDIDDEYNRDSEPSKTSQKCDSSLWNIIKQDPEMRKTFISDVQMYVYNGSLTMSEWNRLSHFNNPFGFMDYRHEDVVPALSLVQKPKYPLLTPKPGRDCISCAVVGTGGILYKSGKGREIDSHDYVIRVNGAAIKGFEEDVGNRTDVYVHTAHSITVSEIIFRKHNYMRAPHDEGIKYVLIPEGLRDFQWLTGLFKAEMITAGPYKGFRPWYQYSGQFNASRFYVLHMDFLRYVRNRFLRSPTLNGTMWHIVRPTNGAFMLFLALQLCDKVDAYGFITERHFKYSNYYFERGADTPVLFFANHNYIMEMELWKKLHNLNIINLYQGESRPTEPMSSPPPSTKKRYRATPKPPPTK